MWPVQSLRWRYRSFVSRQVVGWSRRSNNMPRWLGATNVIFSPEKAGTAGATHNWCGISLAAFGKTQGRHQAGHYRGFRQLEGMRRQAQGRHPRGFDGTGATRFGETLSNRHMSPMSTPGRRGMAWFRGGVAGAPPPHKGGPTRPDRPNCSGQWLVVSCQRLRLVCLRVDRGLTMVCLLPELYESSPPFWDAPAQKLH